MSLFRKYNIENVTGIHTALTPEMAQSIELWNEILNGSADWNKEAKPSGIVGATVGALANPVAEELDVKSNNEKLDIVIKRLNESSKELVQNIVTVGGSVVRPVYANGKMQFEINKLGNYIPTSYDLDGTLTGCIITKEITEGANKYVLLEKHNYYSSVKADGSPSHDHKIEVELYKATGNALKRVSLDTCETTKGVTPVYIWQNVERPFIVEIKNRVPNNIDGSLVPCALWQCTENLIKDADEQYNNITWEQEAGALRVFADEDLFKKRQGSEKFEPRYPSKLNKLFIKLNDNGIDAERITTFAPTLRTPQQVEAFNQILRRCELAWNIGKGTLSDLGEVQQTATQYTGGKKTLYTMIDSIESELEEKYKHLAYIFAYIISALEGEKFDDEITITYNDTARKDPEALRLAALQEVQNGLMAKWEYRVKFYGEDEETAKANAPEEPSYNNFGGLSLE